MLIFKYKFGMQLKNQNEDRELSPQQLYSEVQQYLGSVMFRQAHNYETVTYSDGPYLSFSYDKVPLARNSSSDYSDCTLQQLVKGSNAKFVLSLQILRVLQFNHVLICYTVPEKHLNNPNKFVVLAVVFRNSQIASAWSELNEYLTILQIRNPYKSYNQVYAWTPLVISKAENIIIKKRRRLINRNTDLLKSQANLKFKNKRYQQALFVYQMALGLIKNPQKRRERAVLYANSSQCLYEMRLYESAQIYAQISTSLDHKYIKACFRKFNCQLQLRRLEKIPLTIHAIRRIGTDKQFQQVSAKYTRYLSNSLGFFDWKQVFSGANCNFGEYTSPKLQTVTQEQYSTQPFTYVAAETINQHELILFHKPLVYYKLEQNNFGQDYLKINEQIISYSKYQSYFHKRFSLLPNQYIFQGQIIKIQKQSQRIEMSQTRSKCLRCLELQKSLLNIEANQQYIGIWDSMYYFRHKCLSNCTYLHIKGGLAVFAIRKIEKGEPLSIDFLTLQTKNRQLFMKEKLGRICSSCQFCSWGWKLPKDTEPQLLYIFYQSQKQNMKGDLNKISLYFLWQLLQARSENEIIIMKQYLLVLEKWPAWQCIINCLTYLRTSCRADLFDAIKSTIKRIFEKYFNMTHAQAVELLKQLL